jgi:hypothetical protein
MWPDLICISLPQEAQSAPVLMLSMPYASLICHGTALAAALQDRPFCLQIVHPDYLQCCMGHFYEQQLTGLEACWVLKDQRGFLQTPQSFWNVPHTDALGNAQRIFYGPLMKGRDGAGAVCCVGTGAIFSRDALVSVSARFGEGYHWGSILRPHCPM